MISIQTPTTKPSGFGMPISGHQCAPGKTAVAATVVRDRALTGVTVLGTDVFPGSHAWSPPI